jgi:hypothetical protein
LGFNVAGGTHKNGSDSRRETVLNKLHRSLSFRWEGL